MIPIKDGTVTRLISRDARVVDLLREYGCMPVFKRGPGRRGVDDKPASVQDVKNERRRADYAQRKYGIKPAYLQLWSAP